MICMPHSVLADGAAITSHTLGKLHLLIKHCPTELSGETQCNKQNYRHTVNIFTRTDTLKKTSQFYFFSEEIYS